MRCLDLLPAPLKTFCRGAGYEYDPSTNELELTVTTKRVDKYSLVVLPFTPEPGVAVRLEKITPGSDLEEREGYTVFVADRSGHDSCECKGFIFGRGRACKHIGAVKGLRANGWI